MSICDCSLFLSSKVRATWFNKLKIRRMMLCPWNTSKWKKVLVASWVEWLLTSEWIQIHSQPEKEREARYVQVPLSSEQLHVHMVINIRVSFGVVQRLRPGVLVHLAYSVWGRAEVWNDAADEVKRSISNTHPVKEQSKPWSWWRSICSSMETTTSIFSSWKPNASCITGERNTVSLITESGTDNNGT